MENNQLEKKYGLATAICMVVGTVIGSGVFAKEFQDPEDESGREAPRYANQIFEDAYGGDGPVVL